MKLQILNRSMTLVAHMISWGIISDTWDATDCLQICVDLVFFFQPTVWCVIDGAIYSYLVWFVFSSVDGIFGAMMKVTLHPWHYCLSVYYVLSWKEMIFLWFYPETEGQSGKWWTGDTATRFVTTIQVGISYLADEVLLDICLLSLQLLLPDVD